MGYGLGNILEGVRQGTNDRKQEIRQEESDQIKNDEYAHKVERRGVTESREDANYEFAAEKRALDKSVDDGLRAYISSNGENYKQLIDLYNNSFPDGQNISATRNEDGTFSMFQTQEDGTAKPIGNPLTFDQFGQQALSMKDPQAYMKYRASANAPMKGRFSQNGDGQVLDTATGKTAAGAVSGDDPNGVSQENAEKFFSAKSDKSWGTSGLNGISFGDGGKARSAENGRLAWQIYQKQPAGQKSLTAAHEKALAIVQSKKDRQEFKGKLPGSTDYLDMSEAEAVSAAEKIREFFPDGTEVNEAEMREFMATHNIPKPEEQDLVLKQLGIRSTGSKGLPKSNAKPTAKKLPPNMTSESVLEAATKAVRNGKSRSYIINQLREMGYTDEELNKSGF